MQSRHCSNKALGGDSFTDVIRATVFNAVRCCLLVPL